DWEALPALLSGFTAGKASSAQVNKAIRQSTTIAALVGQFIANSGVDALDNADVNGLVTKFTNALTKNLNLGEGSKLGAAVAVTSTSGRISIPTLVGGIERNIIIQWVTGLASSSAGVATVSLPLAFPNALLFATT
ncbi:phage tail protein, partial [Enterobacter cloacae]